jgi:chromate transporter
VEKALKLLKISALFFYIGLFTLGGGYAMIPLMQQELVEKRHLFSMDEFYEMFAISQVTPGPIAVNMATFIGYREGGIIGSAFATTGVMLPSIIIIIAISLYFKSFIKNPYVHKFFIGILTGVVAEIAYITVDLWKRSETDAFFWFVFLLSMGEIFLFHLNPIYAILIGGAIGTVFYGFIVKEEKQDG